MAFVPGHNHDIFLSYARDEADWLEEFRKRVEDPLYKKLGRKVDFWQDIKKLNEGDNWPASIDRAIDEAAAFIAVCSPLYFRPGGECLKESQRAARLRDEGAFIPVVKEVAPQLPYFHPKIQRADYFVNFPTDSDDFKKAAGRAVVGIAEVLTRLRNSKLKVYVGLCAADMKADREQLEHQLTRDGYAVTAADPALEAGFMTGLLGEAEAAVFLVGGEWDDFVGVQIAAARDAGKRPVVWIHPARSKGAAGRQESLIESVRADAQLLGGVNIRDAIRQMQDLLKPELEVEPLRGNAVNGKVGLIHDPAETEASNRVSAIVKARLFDVCEPKDLGDVPRVIQGVDGLLLYRRQGLRPDNFLLQSFPYIQFADQMYRDGLRPLRARTCLIPHASPFDQAPGVQVISCAGEPTAETLQPFFDRMMGGGA